MKFTSKIVATCLSLALLTGCGSDSSSSKNKDAVYGTWVRTENDMTVTYTLNSDGTYNENVVATGEFPVSMSDDGTFSFDGKEIVLTSSEFQTEITYEVSFDGEDMIWDSGSKELLYIKQ